MSCFTKNMIITKKISNPISSIFLVGLCILCSCSFSDKKKQTAVTDSLRFLKNTDATTFYSDWSKKNTVVFHVMAEPDNLHPANGISAERSLVFSLIHKFVVITDIATLTLCPDMADSMPKISTDGLSYTYLLRKQAKWDNGSCVNAEDIVFSFKAYLCAYTDNAAFKPYLTNISNIITYKGNPLKFTLVMKKKYIQNIAFLTDFPVIQKSIFDPENILSQYTFAQLSEPDSDKKNNEKLKKWANSFNNPDYGRKPELISGLGPYAVSEWKDGISITLVKKKNYWSTASNMLQISDFALPEKIIFVINRDANSQKLEFKSQTYDVTASIDTRSLTELSENADFIRNYHFGFLQTYNYTYMALNMKPDGIKQKKLFTSKNVRKAIAMLVPVDDIIALVDQGKSKRVVGPVSSLKPEFNTELKPVQYNLKAAQKLLESEGWKDLDGDKIIEKQIDGKNTPFEFELEYMNTTPTWKDIALLIKESMLDAGINVVLVPEDMQMMFANAQKHEFDALLSAWGGNSLPDDFTQLWHTSSWISNGSNFTGFGDKTSDALIDSIKYCIVDSLRIPMVKRFQQMVYDEQPYVFIKTGVRKVIVHKRFGNANMYFETPSVLANTLKLLYNTNGVVYKQMSHD